MFQIRVKRKIISAVSGVVNDLKWKLVYYDVFDHSSGIQKQGKGLMSGLYYLWYRTLLETIVEASTGTGKIPDKGFVSYRLVYSLAGNGEKYIEITWTLRFMNNTLSFGGEDIFSKVSENQYEHFSDSEDEWNKSTFIFLINGFRIIHEDFGERPCKLEIIYLIKDK